MVGQIYKIEITIEKAEVQCRLIVLCKKNSVLSTVGLSFCRLTFSKKQLGFDYITQQKIKYNVTFLCMYLDKAKKLLKTTAGFLGAFVCKA